jgi:hypothetical protein
LRFRLRSARTDVGECKAAHWMMLFENVRGVFTTAQFTPEMTLAIEEFAALKYWFARFVGDAPTLGVGTIGSEK